MNRNYLKITITLVTVFSFLLLDSALSEYTYIYADGIYKDILNASTSLAYIILFSLVIVRIIQPESSNKGLYVLFFIFLGLYLLFRIYILNCFGLF